MIYVILSSENKKRKGLVMKNILKTIVSLILVVALLLTATSCAVNGVADAIRESNTGKSGDINYSHTGDSTETASEKETFLQNSTFVGRKEPPVNIDS